MGEKKNNQASDLKYQEQTSFAESAPKKGRKGHLCHSWLELELTDTHDHIEIPK